MTTPTNPAPVPPCDTSEEQRAYEKAAQDYRDQEQLDRPDRWDY